MYSDWANAFRIQLSETTIFLTNSKYRSFSEKLLNDSHHVLLILTFLYRTGTHTYVHTNWWLLLLNNFFSKPTFLFVYSDSSHSEYTFFLIFFLSSLYLNLTLFLLQILHQLVCCSVHTSIRNTNFLTVSGFNNYMLTKNISDMQII